MPPALKALLAQLIGLALAFLLARSGLVAGLWPIVATQAAGATLAAAMLRSARWWLPIHLGFLPLLVGAQRLNLQLVKVEAGRRPVDTTLPAASRCSVPSSL